ncbi:MAG TPA: cell wall-binding repeat-containing protein [Nocardioidaceae bacterium]|nr:cell wall-binding repeat-containing protein [Nocardioidaceae bacterium]
MRTPMNIRRVGLATLATSLVLGGSVVTAGSASAEADFDFQRVSGENRYDTSAKAAEAFGAANTVIIASGERGRYPDALAANYVAGLENAPVLLTRQDETPAEVKQAIKDSGARNIIIVGGESAVSAAQEQALSQDYSVKRLAGDDRWGTAAAIIAEGGDAQGDTALLATGMNFPDALGGGPVAFAEKMPLAITKVDDMPDNVVDELKAAGITKVLVLGGESAVSKAVETELKDKGITVEKRFAGTDRAETSAMLARHAIANFGFKNTAVNVASGYVKGDGADALGGAALTGKQERALLITKSEDTAGAAILKFLGDFAGTLTEGLIFGGTSALTQSLELQLEKAVLGSGAQIGNVLYDTPQEAIDAAKAGDTVTVFGQDNPGFTVKTAGLTVKGENGASVKEAIQVLGVDDVTISGLTITPSNVGGQVAGIYLDNAEDITITGNTVLGTANAGAGVINTSGGEAETATIRNNTFRDLLQGVFANPSATYVIDDNVFRNNTAASANDTASTITDNRFINNDEGIGLGAAGSTVTGNSFGDNEVYVKDYTSDPANYDLQNMITENDFDNEVTVTEDGSAIVDKPAAQ